MHCTVYLYNIQSVNGNFNPKFLLGLDDGPNFADFRLFLKRPRALAENNRCCVQEVFGFVKRNLSGAQRRKEAVAEKGVRGKRQQPLSPPSAGENPERE
jgi:hypothetical protein